ncbi:MAG: type I-E CRISPR-associated protein Cse2/CasB [Gracilibacteraceae bacterium]|jgi:CRISPR system Cascade subunit CasB|nr:type I-E CRISPR-associated protein Cse2/CasB [Gracilibacteraceae bacterium]
MGKIYNFVASRSKALSADTGSARAAKAKLRRAVGKLPQDCPEIWESVLFELEDELARDENALKAIHLALTLFALHDSFFEGRGLGAAMNKLAPPGDDDKKSKKRRFDAAITSNGYEELSNHLRGLVQLLKQEGIGLDCAKLAEDICWFLRGDEHKNRVTLQWGIDYYRTNNTENKSKEDSNNGD